MYAINFFFLNNSMKQVDLYPQDPLPFFCCLSQYLIFPTWILLGIPTPKEQEKSWRSCVCLVLRKIWSHSLIGWAFSLFFFCSAVLRHGRLFFLFPLSLPPLLSPLFPHSVLFFFPFLALSISSFLFLLPFLYSLLLPLFFIIFWICVSFSLSNQNASKLQHHFNGSYISHFEQYQVLKKTGISSFLSTVEQLNEWLKSGGSYDNK